MSNKRKNKHTSPIYTMMLIWITWSILMPLFRISDFLLLAGIGALAYSVVNAAANKRDEQKEFERAQTARPKREEKKEEEKKGSGNPEIDKLIEQRDNAVSEMRRLNMNIEDEKITAQINDMEYTTSQIFEYVIAHPDKVSQISKFLNYYLPTTIKLLNTYDKMSGRGIRGENIDSTMQKVAETLDVIVKAFHKQLDTLFAGDALDVSSDITVMENLMKTEGLADDELSSGINLTVQE